MMGLWFSLMMRIMMSSFLGFCATFICFYYSLSVCSYFSGYICCTKQSVYKEKGTKIKMSFYRTVGYCTPANVLCACCRIINYTSQGQLTVNQKIKNFPVIIISLMFVGLQKDTEQYCDDTNVNSMNCSDLQPCNIVWHLFGDKQTPKLNET